MKVTFFKIMMCACFIGLLSCRPDKREGEVSDYEIDEPVGDSTISNNPREMKDPAEIETKGNASSE